MTKWAMCEMKGFCTEKFTWGWVLVHKVKGQSAAEEAGDEFRMTQLLLYLSLSSPQDLRWFSQLPGWMWSSLGSIPWVYKSPSDVRASVSLPRLPHISSPHLHPQTFPPTYTAPSPSNNLFFSSFILSSSHQTSLWHHKAKRCFASWLGTFGLLVHLSLSVGGWSAKMYRSHFLLPGATMA